MVLSILGTVMLIIGGLGSFASAYPNVLSPCSLNVWDPDPLYPLYPIRPFPLPPTIALYALGTVISLIGTGFLIGVRLNFFSVAVRTCSCSQYSMCK
jgi:hypothetical protein